MSYASLWEISTKLAQGRLEMEQNHLGFVLEYMSRWRMDLLPISLDHNGDPFDRMFIAQANVEGFRLVSRDAKVRLYEVDIFL